MRRILLLAAAAAFSLAAQAQDYPSRPITLVVGSPAGSPTDLATRALADKLTATLGQSVLVRNEAGAHGNIAAEQVARAAPDGYTLLMAATSFVTSPAFFANLSWDPIEDFTPVSLVATAPIIIVVHPSVAVQDPLALVAWTKSRDQELNLASPGATTLQRLSGELFKQVAGVDWVTVHYKGAAPAVQDLVRGAAQVMFASISDVTGHVQAGKLKALAVTTSERSQAAPDVPTLAEYGFPRFSFADWQAVLAPAGTPPGVARRLNEAIATLMSTPAMHARFLSFGRDAATSTPQELGRFLKEEIEKTARIAKRVGAGTR